MVSLSLSLYQSLSTESRGKFSRLASGDKRPAQGPSSSFPLSSSTGTRKALFVAEEVRPERALLLRDIILMKEIGGSLRQREPASGESLPD